ncbi:MAG TPA: hypothetical protein VMW49_02825, partial [Candidatus Dormibacteraeota bacterium]|nr:hypothetical protein [Candidatus Dormibacteraeota bacterium]
MQQWRRLGLIISAGALAAATAAVSPGGAGVSAKVAGGSPTVAPVSLIRVGTQNVRTLARQSQATQPSRSNEQFLLGPANDGLVRRGGTGSASSPVTTVGVQSSGGGGGSTTSSGGFMGITGLQQATANNAYDLEPPDQGLCSNGKVVVENVNNAYAVYTTAGKPVVGPVAMTSLFGIPSESAGTFTSDPRCYYDAATQRWFVVELSIPNLFTKQHATTSYELVAVSQTSDPTGSFTTFAIPTMDPSDPGCPCFGDYPMIGADAHGFYITTNEFSIYQPYFNGAQLYAVSKWGLASAATGGSMPSVVHFGHLPSPFPGETAGETYHLSPALTPAGGTYATTNHGTEYFAMSDAFPVSASDLGVYALTNTASLALSTPSLTLTDTAVGTQTYTFPETGMAVTQKAATASSQTPLADYIASQTGSMPPPGVLQADFQALEETTYTGGHLYTALSSAASSAYSTTYSATVGTTSAEWFVLSPSTSNGGTSVSAALTNEGNVGVSNQSLLYPDLVVNKSGVGDMVFTLS